MRRILFALLASPLSVIVPLAPTVIASDLNHLSQPVPVAPTTHVHHVDRAKLRVRLLANSPTVRALASTARSMHLTVNQLRSEWQNVAICEVGGNWSMTGSMYSGIGFLNATWQHYGGTQFAPLAGQATRDQQILIGMRVTKTYIPDQYGCSPGGW